MSKKTRAEPEIERTGSNKEPDKLRTVRDTKVQGSNLGPYRDATHDLLQHLSQTGSKLKNLETLYSQHAADIANVGSWKQKHEEMERLSTDDKHKIECMEQAMSMLFKKKEEDEKNLADERKRLEDDSTKLTRQRDDHEKRIKAREAENKRELDKKLKQLETSRDEEIKSAKINLETKHKGKLKDCERKIMQFQEQLTTVREELAKEKAGAKDIAQQLSRSREKIDDITRAKRSISNDMNRLKSELENIYQDCGLQSRTVEQYKQDFKTIQEDIQELSGDCIKDFSQLQQNDLDTIRKNLQRSDVSFSFVPISNSVTSFDLCCAHMQRVISAKICDFIWKPFSSDYFLDQPDLSEFLQGLKQVIDTNTHYGSRQAVFWRAQTMQALQTLADTSSTAAQASSIMTRCDKATNAIVSVLEPLIEPLDASYFEETLRKILSSAIRLWDNVLMDKMETSVFRSFGVVSSSISPTKDSEFTKIRPAASQHEGIPQEGNTYTLFPLIEAVVPSFYDLDSLPKAGAPDACKIRLHPGLSLVEASSLVQEGKRELRNKEEFFRNRIEQAKAEYNQGTQQVGRLFMQTPHLRTDRVAAG